MSLDIYLKFNQTEYGWISQNFSPCTKKSAIRFDDYFDRDDFIDEHIRRVYRWSSKHKLNLLSSLESISCSNGVELHSESMVPRVKAKLSKYLLTETLKNVHRDLVDKSYIEILKHEPMYFLEYVRNDQPPLEEVYERVGNEIHAVKVIEDTGLDDLTLFKLSFEYPIIKMRTTKECQDRIIEYLQAKNPDEYQFIGRESLFHHSDF